MTLKSRRKQRILNEISLLEAMNNKLWWQLWGSVIVFFTLVAAIIYSFATQHKDMGWLLILISVIYIAFLIVIGREYKTKLWRYSYIPALATILLVSVLLGGFDPGFSGTPSDMDGKRNEKRYTMNREDLISKALAKRRALLDKLNA